MTDTFARQKQLIGSTADWATNDLVIGDGEFALEAATGGIKIKVGNGTDLFSSLPYVSGSGSGSGRGPVTGAYVPLSGGTMTGPLFMRGGSASTIGLDLGTGPAGDYAELKVRSGEAGLYFVSRDSAGEHVMQWTRGGILVLRNRDPAVSDFMGITCETYNGANSLIFEHTDSEGNEQTEGSFVFKTNPSAFGLVVMHPDGTVSATGTPSQPTHLITKAYADSTYGSASGGLTTTTADARYLKLTGGTLSNTLKLQKNLYFDDPSVMAEVQMGMITGTAGDTFGIAVQSGRSGGISVVSRDRANKEHSLRWTRFGVLVLSNNNGTNNMGIAADTYNSTNNLTFKHCDLEGNETTEGTFVFRTDSNPSHQVKFNTNGTVEVTGSPTAPNHLITKSYADAIYELKGAASGKLTTTTADARYLKLTGGTLSNTLKLQKNLYFDDPSVSAEVQVGMTTGTAGDTFGIAIQKGDDGGISFVSRDTTDKEHNLRWTRNGVLALSNKGNTGNIGIEVKTGTFANNEMIFEHVDEYGEPDGLGCSFIFEGAAGQQVTITNGKASQLGTPNTAINLMTRGASDARYSRVSDKRLKKNIKPYSDDALAKINKLRPVSFGFIDDIPSKQQEMHPEHFGLIAQEAIKVVPELVYKNDADSEYYGIDYVELVPLLIKAVQQLTERLEAK